MLNVAVSRAKDSFIVFGDMDIFNPELKTPSGMLACHLFADEENEITSIQTPTRFGLKGEMKVNHIRDLDLHVRTLRRAFHRAKRKLTISLTIPSLAGG